LFAIKSEYLQIIQDVFNYVPRVYGVYVLKEEVVAQLKRDP
jgi:hypothetical protein